MTGTQANHVGLENSQLNKLNASLKQDSKRWLDGYINHSATAIRRRVLAHLASNNGGH